ncbi:helix-turn-helix transcriptional regulator [uncultured Brevundimonas sp.]|uniref:helix-turn-helix domain-containing protein n=1 Tax=uncultured Brevundimonas sp. TaxID=213418 RepID=UPI0026002932|nr:helix-turn-helix transcriptional regulator [uncultured Brevundimonas sp.]
MTLGDTSVLDSLNNAERDILTLLAQGHTAKSIAMVRAVSLGSVNERLRSARRKTGIGSSRELARLVAGQENRDDFIDLAASSVRPATSPRTDAPRRASSPRWRLPMTAAVLIAATILAQQSSVAPTPPPRADRQVPSAAEALFAPRSTEPDISALHAEVMSGGVDPAWSATTEASLRRIYDQAIAPDALTSFEVTCSVSLCELIGVGRPGLIDEPVTVFTEAVQGPDVHHAVSALGLHSVMNGFTVTRDNAVEGEPSVMIFAAYWRRTK